jgi:hypothetical protein
VDCVSESFLDSQLPVSRVAGNVGLADFSDDRVYQAFGRIDGLIGPLALVTSSLKCPSVQYFSPRLQAILVEV